jgi:hypothetical protein
VAMASGTDNVLRICVLDSAAPHQLPFEQRAASAFGAGYDLVADKNLYAVTELLEFISRA